MNISCSNVLNLRRYIIIFSNILELTEIIILIKPYSKTRIFICYNAPKLLTLP